VQSATVLVVEDDDDIRESVRLVLEDAGYRVLEASDGAAGLAAIQRSAYPLVVLVDYMMPRMNGLEMLGEVVKHERLARRHVFLLVTANYDRLPARSDDLVASLSIRTVRKPFDLDVLLTAVERACSTLPTESGPGGGGGDVPPHPPHFLDPRRVLHATF
jgi:CheY-like chemotaxis protein